MSLNTTRPDSGHKRQLAPQYKKQLPNGLTIFDQILRTQPNLWHLLLRLREILDAAALLGDVQAAVSGVRFEGADGAAAEAVDVWRLWSGVGGLPGGVDAHP